MPQLPLTRLMMVEDDEDIRTVAQVSLEALGGFDVRMCESGAEALTAVPIFHPQLILLDVMMPDMDGIATLAALRAKPGGALTPVVFMTAKVQPQEVRSYLELGALDVIAKPFDPMTLADTVRRIWETRPE